MSVLYSTEDPEKDLHGLLDLFSSDPAFQAYTICHVDCNPSISFFDETRKICFLSS